MTLVLFDDVVKTDYGQFDLEWTELGRFDGDFDRCFAGQVNGLVGVAHETGVYVNLARRSGGSRVRIVLEPTAPPLPPARYEDVVEVPVTIPPDAEVKWVSWAAESSGLLHGLIPGHYRLRVSAHGRDAGRAGEFEPEIVDDYLLEFWPAPITADEIVRVESRDAAYWHEAWGGRR